MPRSWESYGKGSFRNKKGSYSGVAAQVLTACGIPQGAHAGSGGGSLSGVDIKRMDAMAAIKASLFESIIGGSLLELIVDHTGVAKIVEVGAGSASLSDVYYTIQSYSFRNNSSAVMVTGGTPLPERSVGGYIELLSTSFNVKYWQADVIMSACAMANLKRFVTITYDDPHRSSNYNDGIDNLYNVTNPFESVVGYAYDVENGTDDPYVEITHSDKATVPIRVSGLGVLAITELAAADYTNEDKDCMRGLGSTVTCGAGAVTLEIPSELRFESRVHNSVDKFLGVSSVYVVGYKATMGFLPKTDTDSMSVPSSSNVDVWIIPEDTTLDIVKLDEGKHYAVGYDSSEVCIQFADRAPLDMQGICGEGVEVLIPSWVASNDSFSQTVDLLPLNESEVIVVTEIWAAIDIDSPCINIFDPKGSAMDIAESMSIRIAPIKLIKNPAPVGYNGSSVDLKDGVADHDPTTTQDFQSSAIENAMDAMNGKVGMSVTMACFTSESEVATFSGNLQNLYDGDSGVSTVFLCGPGSHAEPGDSCGGGIVNSVEYRYNDSASATVSIETGPKFASNFVGSVSGGTYSKAVESVTLMGTVVGDCGNGSHYTVFLEGIGRTEAMSGVIDIIRVGDIVSVSVNNNPVEA